MGKKRKIRFSFFGSVGFLSLMKSLYWSFVELVNLAGPASYKDDHKNKESFSRSR